MSRPETCPTRARLSSTLDESLRSEEDAEERQSLLPSASAATSVGSPQRPQGDAGGPTGARSAQREHAGAGV